MKLFDDFVPASTCAGIIERYGARVAPALVNTPQGKVEQPDLRMAKDFKIPREDSDVAALLAKVGEEVSLPVRNFELPRLIRYDVGGFYGPHFDLVPSAIAQEAAGGGQRIATGLLYLNEGFTGGETVIGKSSKDSITPQTGRLCLFYNVLPDGRPDPESLHESRPLRKGVKWVLTIWMREREHTPSPA